jgi:hypothetical protein
MAEAVAADAVISAERTNAFVMILIVVEGGYES